MKIVVNLIRHGKTKGNELKQYIGVTDEDLSTKGVEELNGKSLRGSVDKLFCSPLKRCVQTADILYPNVKYQIVNELAECDFGEFEGKSYDDLKDNPEYQRWIDSNGEIPFPQGEDNLAFRARCINAFDKIIKWCESEHERGCYNNISVVCHGGTIMSILERYSDPNQGFYNWQVKNGDGYSFSYDTDTKKARDIILI